MGRVYEFPTYLTKISNLASVYVYFLKRNNETSAKEVWDEIPEQLRPNVLYCVNKILGEK